MNGGKPHDPAPKAGMDNNDPLWRLLAQAPRPEPDAWFAARTMARCRNEGLGGDERFAASAFSRIWRWALGGGLAVCMAVALMIPLIQNQPHVVPVVQPPNVQDAFEIMASMNTVNTVSTDSDSFTSSSWQDSSL